MKIAIHTLGCKLNQAETESLARELLKAGHNVVNSVESADIYILNTCTVTQAADAKARQLLRAARRRNPAARLVAAGCYAERQPKLLAEIAGVGLVAGSAAGPDIIDWLQKTGQPATDGNAGPETAVRAERRTRASIKIQDGCDANCAYCIVPKVRGRGKSRSAREVLDEVSRRVEEGYREVVLTGTEVGTYSHEGTDLEGLLKRALAETEIQRLRLSSLQPGEITSGLLQIWRDPRMCPHFHISLQSGSDAVLRRMRRRYSVAGYRESVSLIRRYLPEAAITTDIIVGFPGETDADFAETLQLCRELGFARVHVFPFSPRAGTEAAASLFRVPDSDRTQRNQKLRALGAEAASDFARRFSGRTMDVLWEKRSGGLWTGHTANYIKVYTREGSGLANRITPARLTEAFRDGMLGEPCLENRAGNGL